MRITITRRRPSGKTVIVDERWLAAASETMTKHDILKSKEASVVLSVEQAEAVAAFLCRTVYGVEIKKA